MNNNTNLPAPYERVLPYTRNTDRPSSRVTNHSCSRNRNQNRFNSRQSAVGTVRTTPSVSTANSTKTHSSTYGKGSTMKEIVRYLKDRNVRFLVHFTPLSNLAGIKRRGIVPRSELQASADEPFLALDGPRYDLRRNMSCFSVSFPNPLMMYCYQKRLKEEYKSDVALLFIPVERLENYAENQVLFHTSNAACSNSRRKATKELQGLQAAEAMFAEKATTRDGQEFSRTGVKLPSYLTTDPQAEVQIAGVIPWSAVAFVVVNGYERKRKLQKEDPNLKVYAGWKVERQEGLNVFRYPSFWNAWREKGEVSNG